MLLNRRRAAWAPIIAALTIGAPAIAGAATPPTAKPVVTGPSCPDGYAGPTNPATGCPYYLMSYTVSYPGGPSFRCPVIWGVPQSESIPAGCGGVGSTTN
jgi:hypothetical protein